MKAKSLIRATSAIAPSSSRLGNSEWSSAGTRPSCTWARVWKLSCIALLSTLTDRLVPAGSFPPTPRSRLILSLLTLIQLRVISAPAQAEKSKTSRLPNLAGSVSSRGEICLPLATRALINASSLSSFRVHSPLWCWVSVTSYTLYVSMRRPDIRASRDIKKDTKQINAPRKSLKVKLNEHISFF